MSHRVNIVLCLLTGVLFGLAYPPVGLGILAVVGFIPLFLLISGDESFSDVFRHAYGAFFVFNLVSLYWPGGFVHMRDPYLMVSGALLILAHPIFMSLPILVWHSVRKTLGMIPSLATFPFIWVAFEFAHSSTQLSFPWLSLGYSMSYDLASIQVASVAGIYAVSFWIVLLNVLIFVLLSRAMVRGRANNAGFIPLAAIILVVYALPYLFGAVEDGGDLTTDGNRVSVALVQPDIDPFEKWSGLHAGQMDALRNYTDSIVSGSRPDLVIWPETAVPYYILSGTYREEYLGLRRYVDSLGVPLLSGIPDIVMYPETSAAPAGAKKLEDGTSYETFNSSMLLIPRSEEIQKFAKSILVPFAERVPYSDVLGFLNAARWNFGLGGWSVGRDTALFRLPVGNGDTLRFANMICYESVYPGFVSGLVHRGAGFLTVVTNDSWWGNTSGPYQHRQFAVVRAVENRRWVAQCANGGISFIVDPSGRVVEQTKMFTAGGLSGTIRSRTEQSFYSRHGDWFAEICLVLTLFLFAATGLQRVFRKKMSQGT
jgi:apolipoprotein N-acyltransferase